MIRYLLVFMLGFAMGLAVHSDAKAQSATSIIQQSSRADSSPCGYANLRDWWNSIVTCRVVQPDGSVVYVRRSAR